MPRDLKALDASGMRREGAQSPGSSACPQVQHAAYHLNNTITPCCPHRPRPKATCLPGAGRRPPAPESRCGKWPTARCTLCGSGREGAGPGEGRGTTLRRLQPCLRRSLPPAAPPRLDHHALPHPNNHPPVRKLSERRSAWMVATTMMLSSLAGSSSRLTARYAIWRQQG